MQAAVVMPYSKGAYSIGCVENGRMQDPSVVVSSNVCRGSTDDSVITSSLNNV